MAWEYSALEPAWSPTGWLAYWGMHGTSQRDIWTRPAGGGKATQVTDDAFVDWSPAWSPDGRYLFFCSDRSGSANVWRVAIDDQTGAHLAYQTSDRQAGLQRIAFDPVAAVVRGDPVPLTSGTHAWTYLDVSVDGRLVFQSAERQEDICVSDGDGKTVTPLAPDEDFDRWPRWSPDGTRIAFSSTKGGTGYQIFLIRPDGSDLRQVTFMMNAVHYPFWSPDGRLAFTNFTGSTYAIDPDKPWPTDPLTLLVTPPPPAPLDVRYTPWSWSPDGRRIAAFSRSGAGMIVYDMATGAHEVIAEAGARPRWLRDSRRLLYTDEGALRLMDTRTKQSREIYRSPAGTISDPVISHDDKLIYYILNRAEGDIWLATLK